MPVRVPTAGTDQREVRTDPLRELRRLVRRPVVGDLDHVHLGQRTVPGRAGEEPGLSRWLQVTEGQHRDGADLQEQDDAGVVGGVLVTAEVARRPEHPPAHRTGVTGPGKRGRRRDLHRHARVVEQVARTGGLPGRLGQRAHQRRSHLPAPDHGTQPSDVVRVVVAEHQEVDPVDAETTEAGVRGTAVRTDVDHHGAPRPGPQHHRVALPDVARDHRPVAREAAGTRGRCPQGTSQHHDAEEDDHQHRTPGRRGAVPHPPEGPPAPPEPPRRPEPTESHQHDQRRHDGQADGAPGAARPRQPRARQTRRRACDGRDPPDGATRARREDGGDAREPGREDGSGDAEQGRGQQRDSREQVGRHRVERDRGVEEHQDGPAGSLRGQRHGDEARQHRPGAGDRLEAASRRGSEQDDGRGRGHAQHEPVVARDPRVDHDEHEDGARKGRHGPGGPPQQHPEDAHRTHHRGPDDGRPRVRQQHEAGHRHSEEDCRGTPPEPDRTTEPAESEPEDGEVPARDGRDVGESGRPHRLLEVGRDPRGVTDGGTGHEATQVGREVVGDPQEGGAHPSGGLVDPERRTELDGRGPAVEQGDGTLAVGGRRERTPDLDDRAVPQVGGWTEDDHLSARRRRRPAHALRGDHTRSDDRPGAAAPERRRSADDLPLEDDGGAVLREGSEDAGVAGFETDVEGATDRDDRREDQHGPGDARPPGTAPLPRSLPPSRGTAAPRATSEGTTPADRRDGGDHEDPEQHAAHDADDHGHVARGPPDEDRSRAPGGHRRGHETQVEPLVAGLRRGHGSAARRAGTARSR